MHFFIHLFAMEDHDIVSNNRRQVRTQQNCPPGFSVGPIQDNADVAVIDWRKGLQNEKKVDERQAVLRAHIDSERIVHVVSTVASQGSLEFVFGSVWTVHIFPKPFQINYRYQLAKTAVSEGQQCSRVAQSRA